MGAEAVDQEQYLPAVHPFIKPGEPLKHNHRCHPGLLIMPPHNIY